MRFAVKIFGVVVGLYEFFGVLGLFLIIIFNLSQSRKINLCRDSRHTQLMEYTINPEANGLTQVKKRRNGKTLLVIHILVLSILQFLTGYGMNKALGAILTDGTDNYFGTAVIAPAFLVFLAHFMGFDPIKYLDTVTPAYALSLTSFKLGCFCSDCCSGIECSIGIYYESSRRFAFPVQLVESAVALIIFFILLYYRKKAKLGLMHPVFLILYSSTRFFSEFLRIEPSIAGPFKMYHFCCLAGCLIGIIEYQIMKRHAASIDSSVMSLFLKKTEPDKE